LFSFLNNFQQVNSL